MAEIALCGKNGAGKVVLVDDQDLPLISQYKWYFSSRTGYAITTKHVSGNKRIGVVQKNIVMHKLIMATKPGEYVDHINRDKLDNRRCNLRTVSPKQNVWNAGKQKDNTTGFIGVRQESKNVFVAKLGRRTIGYYRTVVEAAQARDIAALKERGEFAVLNFKAEDLPSHVVPLPPRNTGERTSSVVGVSYAKNQVRKCKWRAVYKKRHLGWFATEEEAVAALMEVKNEG